MSALLEVRGLSLRFPAGRTGAWPWSPRRNLQAVRDVSFELAAGETLGIVGESGCGKSSLARALIGLNPVSTGSIRFAGRELAGLSPRDWRGLRGEIQMVFQDPLSSLDPRMTIAQCIAEPLQAQQPGLSAASLRERVTQMMARVGLAVAVASRYPHEFSGGQCQRVGIARALIVRPRLLVCDEPVSALDVSIQAQVINLFARLQREEGLAMLFIAHDLAVVRHISDRVLVMYLGQVMEAGPAEALFATPAHPYTRALLAAVPRPEPHGARAPLPALQGEVPSPLTPPSGCVFRTRCPRAQDACAERAPSWQETAGHGAACLRLSEDEAAPRNG